MATLEKGQIPIMKQKQAYANKGWSFESPWKGER